MFISVTVFISLYLEVFIHTEYPLQSLAIYINSLFIWTYVFSNPIILCSSFMGSFLCLCIDRTDVVFLFGI